MPQSYVLDEHFLSDGADDTEHEEKLIMETGDVLDRRIVSVEAVENTKVQDYHEKCMWIFNKHFSFNFVTRRMVWSLLSAHVMILILRP